MKTSEKTRFRLESYLKAKFPSIRGKRGVAMSLMTTDLGIHNHVFHLNIEGGPPLIVKGIFKRQRFLELLDNASHLKKNGIRVPMIVFAKEDKKLCGRLGMHIICEERIFGKTLFEMKDPSSVLPDVARIFSRMHNIQRKSWGKVSNGKRNGFYENIIEKTEKKLRRWKQVDPAFDTRNHEKIIKWLVEYSKPVRKIHTFSLCHGDPNPGNIIVNEENSIVLLDVGNTSYLPRTLEFYNLLVNCFIDQPEMWSILENTYFEEMPEAEQEQFDSTRPFFKVYALSAFASSYADLLSRANPSHRLHKKATVQFGCVKKSIASTIGV